MQEVQFFARCAVFFAGCVVFHFFEENEKGRERKRTGKGGNGLGADGSGKEKRGSGQVEFMRECGMIGGGRENGRLWAA